MDKKGELTLGVIFAMFITLIVGIILVTTLVDPISEFDETLTYVNDSITFSDGASELDQIDSNTNTLQSQVITTGTILTNSTNSTIGTNNYNVYTNGSIVLEGGAKTDLGASSAAALTYNHYSNSYVENNIARTLMNLIGLFFVLGLLLIIIGKLTTGDWLGILRK